MIKILHIVDKLSFPDSTIHGVTRLLSWWIPRFDKSRYQLCICTLRSRDKAGEYLEDLGVRVFYLNKGKFDPSTLISLLDLIKKERFDILHLHGYGGWTFGRLAGVLCRIPTVLHEHMANPNIPLYQQVTDRILSSKTSRAIAVSKSVKEFVVRYRGLHGDCVNVVINGIPLELFRSGNGSNGQKSSVNDWRTRLSIPLSHKIVGAVGRLHIIKGHRYFLEVARKVLREVPNVTFVIAGDGELRQPLEEMAQSLGIAPNVRFLGFCDDVPGVLSTMDIMVIASLSEGVPLTLFEAMAAGCAIVSTNVGGLPEVLMEGKTAFLVPPKDAAAMSGQIVQLLRDSKLLTKMKTAAFEDSARFDITKTISQIENTYRGILNT